MNTLKFVVTASFFLLVSLVVTAQVSGDSVNALKQQKQSLELSKKINDNKLKLAKMENTLNAKTTAMESSATDAQRAADDNSTAAGKLSGDPQNKKLARQAESAADDAKKKAKRARVANDNLADLKKDMLALKGNIAEEEAKLAANPLIIPIQ